MFQSPSPRGRDRFSEANERAKTEGNRVSIPFTTGQRSLPRKLHAHTDADREFQSPSPRGRDRFPTATNPPVTPTATFQSPSPRGRDRFLQLTSLFHNLHTRFQSPSPRGRDRFGMMMFSLFMAFIKVSIPFTTGQRSLHPRQSFRHPRQSLFQSPSPRGRDRFTSLSDGPEQRSHVSIPFTTGQRSLLTANYSTCPFEPFVSIPFTTGQRSLRFQITHLLFADEVSIPFTTGQRSLPSYAAAASDARKGFNPLHHGAEIASSNGSVIPIWRAQVSIPFTTGQRSLLIGHVEGDDWWVEVSIPFTTGQRSLHDIAFFFAGFWV